MDDDWDKAFSYVPADTGVQRVKDGYFAQCPKCQHVWAIEQSDIDTRRHILHADRQGESVACPQCSWRIYAAGGSFSDRLVADVMQQETNAHQGAKRRLENAWRWKDKRTPKQRGMVRDAVMRKLKDLGYDKNPRIVAAARECLKPRESYYFLGQFFPAKPPAILTLADVDKLVSLIGPKLCDNVRESARLYQELYLPLDEQQEQREADRVRALHERGRRGKRRTRKEVAGVESPRHVHNAMDASVLE